MIALAGQADFDFIPYEAKPLRIVENQPLQHRAVGNLNKPAVVEVTTHPIAGFHNGGSHHRDVNHVALGLIRLDSVAYAVEI